MEAQEQEEGFRQLLVSEEEANARMGNAVRKRVSRAIIGERRPRESMEAILKGY